MPKVNHKIRSSKNLFSPYETSESKSTGNTSSPVDVDPPRTGLIGSWGPEPGQIQRGRKIAMIDPLRFIVGDLKGIQCFFTSGKFCFRIPTTDPLNPYDACYDVAVYDKQIIALCSSGIKVFDFKGELQYKVPIKSVGLGLGGYIALNKASDELFVSGYEQGKINVFHLKDRKWTRSFEASNSSAMCVDSNGRSLFVVNNKSKCIQVYTLNGTLTRQWAVIVWPKKPRQPPAYIADVMIHNDQVYVCLRDTGMHIESNDGCIQLYTPTGTLTGEVEGYDFSQPGLMQTEKFDNPRGVAMSTDGTLIVACKSYLRVITHADRPKFLNEEL